MRHSTRWKNKRRMENYRRMTEVLDEGMYALALIQAFTDDEIEFEIDDRKEQIKTNLENCAEFLAHIQIVSEDPTQGTTEERQLIEETNIKCSLTTLHDAIEVAQKDLETPPNFDEVYDSLRELEQYANFQMRRYRR